MKDRTIVQVVSYYPPHLGGMENCAAHIAEGFVRRGEKVQVYTSFVGYNGKGVDGHKADVYYLHSLEIAHTPIMFTLFFRLLMLPKNACMHLHISQAFAPEIVFLIAKMRGIPYVAHIHLDVDPSGPLGFLLKPYKKYFLKPVLHAANAIICLSEGQKSQISEKYKLSPASITVIPNGVGSEFFLPLVKKDAAVPHFLFVGRLAPQKNLPFLFSAIAKMKQHAIFDIVGDGEDRADLEKLKVSLGLENVIFHGMKSAESLILMYRNADLFVLPSLKEGVSLAMLEAMAAGLPIVASYSPEMDEIIGNCGVLIKNATVETYAAVFDSLCIQRDEIQRLSELSNIRAGDFTWDQVLDRIATIYDRL